MVDITDTWVAHIMVFCPMRPKHEWSSVLGFCKRCEYCQSFCVDPNDGHITAVRCEYNKRNK